MQTVAASEQTPIEDFSLWQVLLPNENPTRMPTRRYLDPGVEADTRLPRAKGEPAFALPPGSGRQSPRAGATGPRTRGR